MLEENKSVGSVVSELGEVSMDNSNHGSIDGDMDFSYDFKSKKKNDTDILAAQAQCYKRLSDLLEKSQRYTALLCDRIEKDNNSFALLLKAKSEQMMKQVKQGADKNSKKVPELKKRGRPPKRKREEVDQVVPNPPNMNSVLQGENLVQASPVIQIHSGTESKDNYLSYNQPLLVTGGRLRKYQLEGVSWLMKLYLNGVNGILADEMGLGKTIQCISFISDLICVGATGPFLVCGPLSTLLNWVNEFKKFAPAVPCIMYYGKNKDERIQILGAINDSVTLPGYGYKSKPVVITSYEVAINDSKLLGKIRFDLLIVDEGHRIKNSNCRLIRELKSYNASHRLLLTGTPLQNNLSELWTLLNFLIPEIFSSSGSFETWFDVNFLENVDNAGEQIAMEEEKSSTLSKIHQILTPFMLRRLKADVDIIIPPKKELLLIAPFAPEQRILYKSILDKTISQISAANVSEKESEEVDLPRTLRKRGRKSVDYTLAFEDVNENDEDDENSLTAWAEAVVSGKEEVVKESHQSSKVQQPLHVKHMLSMLRKCCNHPVLLQTREEGVPFREEFVSASGKLHLMDRMLAKLKSQNHRVLIFSQSTQLLDLLDVYCTFRGHFFCRLDGRMSFTDRQEEIQRFNEKDVFLFLLSTRAGGLGINLTKADTVIIYDSDWNPQCDLQAQDRCHRIGQSNPVVVYRLVAGGSVDQKIVERATAKRKLEKIIIHKGFFLISLRISYYVSLGSDRQPILGTDKFKVVDSQVSHGNESKVVDPRELLDILKETDYQDVVKDAGMSDDDLDRLLDRSDLIKALAEGTVKSHLRMSIGRFLSE